ncbi:MAG TPA: hypothetical protein LFW20_06540 [Rickettsia endosymbiont of Omalisus fontisbellaquei]|nr:hypothetical protein [Rickettsia endosymbiont of Omalisus fontisbellaquei]
MLKKFILVLLCISSYKSLGKSNNIEKERNSNLVDFQENLSDTNSDIGKPSIFIKDEQLKEYKELYILNKNQWDSKLLSPNKNTKPIVIGIQDNFEELHRVKGDDIHTARQRKLIQNSWLKDDSFNYQPVKDGKTIGIEDLIKDLNSKQQMRELYIQQIKAKKSPK